MEIYLDANATTPVLPQAKAAAIQAMVEDYGNPSSVHSTGLKAKALIDGVRARAQRLLDTGDGALLFTSGATEGIQTAVLSALSALRGNLNADYLLYGATEHKAVPEALKHWNAVLGLGLQILAIPVDAQGRHDLEFLRRHAPRAGLVCTMAANNETGIVSDLAGIEAALGDSACYWLVDGVQALGKLSLKLRSSRIDYAPFSGHKLYAPKGIGLLYVRAGAPFTPLMAGGGQEGALRSGTENMSGIAALGAVLAALEDGQTLRDSATMQGFRQRLADALCEAFPGLVFNAPLDVSLPTTLNFAVPGLSSRLLQDLFDAADVRVSGGSACSAAKAAPSFVLQAMGLPDWQAAGAVRLSIGPAVDEAFIDEACARIRACGESLRRHCLSPADNLPTLGEGITRFMHDGACCYLLADSASRRCVLIDPRPEQVDRLVQALHCQDYPVLAILSSSGEAEHAEARGLLMDLLNAPLRPTVAVDALGWPNGQEALHLGERRLLRKPCTQGQVLLLNAPQAPDTSAIAFTGMLDAQALRALALPLAASCFLAPGRDEAQQVVLGLAEAADTPHLLTGAQLQSFIKQHPNALLVDVREPFEQFLSQTPELAGAQMQAVALSRLMNALPEWLDEPGRPLLFFCRSGNRSRQAAQALTRLGHPNAWTLNGGLALMPSFSAKAPAADPALYV
ncbi:aminotransferase class V-fold PLP-dependent enzyme [Paucibacter sp. Y2R2-4]|uniref:aminotransferase class V-fold PLP-dependent enzyme n=1 Tax=Paucibacter sp. Y2R2-4 TaxID=2893553 RepID=UPI0021E436A1|nr:aminotransferase class V-fold PLP-dependent enzyme [Paucibacter sp. Y2R2-4]MCV2351439.1 aminotransferase class V-fold PLP-dependent enzyme [Paucibacter sp. Y2R2-4]